MNKEKELEYDSEDDVSIRSLFSSMSSVDDTSSIINNVGHYQKNIISKKNSIESNLINKSFQTKQNILRPEVKFPNIQPNKKVTRSDNQLANIFYFNPQIKSKPLENFNSVQDSRIPNFAYNTPQNRFILNIPNFNQTETKRNLIYAKINNVRLVPIIYDSRQKLSPNRKFKVVHHYNYVTEKNLVKNQTQVKNNRNTSKSHILSETGFREPSSEFDYYDSSQYFSYNEFNGDIEKKSFFKTFNDNNN